MIETKMCVCGNRRDFGSSDCSSALPPEWGGDVRDPKAGCWRILDSKPNSTTSDPVHCREKCVDGSRYCEQHQRRMTDCGRNDELEMKIKQIVMTRGDFDEACCGD